MKSVEIHLTGSVLRFNATDKAAAAIRESIDSYSSHRLPPDITWCVSADGKVAFRMDHMTGFAIGEVKEDPYLRAAENCGKLAEEALHEMKQGEEWKEGD